MMPFESDETVGQQTNEREESSLPVMEASHVGKIYCRNLRQSLWYGVQDVFREMTFRPSHTGQMRPGEFEAIKDASFKIFPGECVALLGPNGAGKSSMLKLINGILRPSHGEIRIRGRISALIELGTGFNPILTGRENVFVNASILGFSRAETEELFDEILQFSELGEFIDAPVRTYSSGMKVRLGFAVASHLAPDLMLIDEVLAVGDLAFRMKCREHLKEKVKTGLSVVLVSHIITLLPKFCTRAIVFDQGSIVFDGDIMEGISEYQRVLGLEKAKTDSVSRIPGEGIIGDPQEMPTEERAEPDVQISEVRTLDKNLRPCKTFCTNDEMAVEVVLNSRSVYRKCKLVLSIDSSTFGVVACMPSQRSGFTFDIVPGKETKVLIRLERMPIIDGKYFFDITLFGSGKSEILDQKNVLSPFQIFNKNEKARALKGVLALDNQWSIQEEENEN